MALNPNALTTVARVKIYLEKTTAEQDTLIEMLINRISEGVAGDCRRQLLQADYTETLKVERCFDVLQLEQYPIETDTLTVTINEVEITDFTVLSAASGQLKRESGWVGDVVVEYTAGYILPGQATGELVTNIPSDLEGICIELVAIALQMKGSEHLKTETVGPLRAEFLPGRPPHIDRDINRYKKPVI